MHILYKKPRATEPTSEEAETLAGLTAKTYAFGMSSAKKKAMLDAMPEDYTIQDLALYMFAELNYDIIEVSPNKAA